MIWKNWLKLTSIDVSNRHFYYHFDEIRDNVISFVIFASQNHNKFSHFSRNIHSKLKELYFFSMDSIIRIYTTLLMFLFKRITIKYLYEILLRVVKHLFWYNTCSIIVLFWKYPTCLKIHCNFSKSKYRSSLHHFW